MIFLSSRLTVTKVVFESKAGGEKLLDETINSNKSCFWMQFLVWYLLLYWLRLTVTKVVFE